MAIPSPGTVLHLPYGEVLDVIEEECREWLQAIWGQHGEVGCIELGKCETASKNAD